MESRAETLRSQRGLRKHRYFGGAVVALEIALMCCWRLRPLSFVIGLDELQQIVESLVREADVLRNRRAVLGWIWPALELVHGQKRTY